ncbi:13560_t:CDS:2 [Funneliformis geosporum]|uniref:4682_t:CDS:1 n=1 Tax=Funneliformis geosporum TaxID=1117311 RepID=A0A9W4WTJ1_9GLOM|nr:4682_t:CDS:2 [Funneliformis geosporum]CAI2174473.1 13560_t:CDS:2 [Funneliformis geosporum]
MSLLLPLFLRKSSHHYQSIPESNQHIEQHFESPEIIRDIVLGLSDGLTATGLSSLGDPRVVIIGGFAELISGSISMGCGGYLAAKSDLDHYDTERRREEWEVKNCLSAEIQEIVDILSPYGLDEATVAPIIEKLKDNPEKFVDFMMKFELNLERPDPSRSLKSAFTIGISYFIGGLVPLIPYFFIEDTTLALLFSSVITIFCLIVFGFVKAAYTSPNNALSSAIQTALVGALAAAASYGGVKLVEGL